MDTEIEAKQPIKEKDSENTETSNTEKRKRLSSGEEPSLSDTKKLKQIESEVSTSVGNIETSLETGSKQIVKEEVFDSPQNETSKTLVDVQAESSGLESKKLLQQGTSDMEHDSSDEEGGGDEKNLCSRSRKNKKTNLKNRLEVSSLGLQVLSK